MHLYRLALAAIPLLLIAQQPATSPQAANPQPTKPEDRCTIEGQVANSLTGDPVRKARVTLQGMRGPNRSGYSAVTDAAGHFIVRDVDPGQYYLTATRNGFGAAQYGARRPNQGGTSLALNPGQHINDVALRLVPHGIITGRVLDEDGEPVEHAQVSTMRYRFVNGKRQLAPAGGGTGTNDLGEYRIFGLAPGKYYLTATFRRRNMMAQERTASQAPDEGYAPTYYPGTNDPAGAVAIAIGPGAMLNLADLTLRKTRTVRVRGHVVNTMGEGLPQRVMIRLVSRNTPYMGFFSMLTTQVMRNQGGAFELRGVAPGAYVLWAQWSDESTSYSVKQPVDVGNTNVDDANLALAPGFELKGQVRVEGNAEVSPGAMWVMLDTQMFPMGRPNVRVDDDRSFTLENVSADKYTVNVRGFPENFYVKSIRMGDADGLESGLDLTRGVNGALDVLISPNGGQIDGAVSDPKQRPAVGATVVLAPDEGHREQPSLFKIAVSDQYGHFTIKGIAPGDYKLFAWEQIEFGAYQDPEFLKPYENDGESITIREGSRENRQLKLIPADAASQQNAGN